MILTASSVESVADKLASECEALAEVPCGLDDAELETGFAVSGNITDDVSERVAVELARLAVVRGYVGISREVDTGREDDSAALSKPDMLVVILVGAAGELVPTDVLLASCTVDAEVAASEDVGAALGRTFALSALIMSAA